MVVMVVATTAGVQVWDEVAGGEWCGWFREGRLVMVVLVVLRSSDDGDATAGSGWCGWFGGLGGGGSW